VTQTRRKAIILGLDGATWDVLLPRVERGEMPNLAGLLERGAWGGLRSTTPPFSAQAWVSLSTGKNQARHGVVDFWERSPGAPLSEHRTFVSSRLVRGETLWQAAGRHGRRVGVVNVPVSYPPTPVEGYLVSGFLTPPDKPDYVYPEALKDEIEALVPGYKPDPFDPLGATQQQLVELADWMEKHEKVARQLMERHPADLFFSVVQAVDHLQHLFWNDIAGRSADPGRAALIDHCYTLADDILGHRLERLDGETAFFLVSDHGFGPAHKWFHVNRFLLEQGLLALGEAQGSGPGAALARLGLTPQRLRDLMRRLDVLGLRRRVGRLARVTVGRQIDGALSRPIDWSRTQAVSGSPASEGIFVNLKGREPNGVVEPGEPYEALRDRLAGELLTLRDPDTGERVVQAVYRREELYSGPFLDLLPDLVFDLGNGPYLASDAPMAARVLEPLPPSLLQGRHRPTGVLAAAGAGIAAGQRIEGARIVDVAPTVLYALDLPIPDDMDGRPLVEIFDDGYRAAHPVRYEPAVEETDLTGFSEPVSSTEEEEAEMERRLRGLGYIS
jgi:predicted AlkP superfamily phosphohydrolase/phosphomutase